MEKRWEPTRAERKAAASPPSHLDLLNWGSQILGDGLDAFRPRVTKPQGPFAALMLLSTYVYRGSRVVALAVAHGYSSEAVGVYRRMVESGSALHYLADDATGQRAAEWFVARGRKGAKLVGQDHWEMLSRSAHADARHSAWMRDAEDTTAVHASRLPIDDLVCVLAAAQCADVARHVLTNARAEHRDFSSFDRAVSDAMTKLEARYRGNDASGLR